MHHLRRKGLKMNYKKAAIRSAVIIGIIVVSILFGLIYQAVSESIDKSNYPIKFSESVEKYSVTYGVPQNVIYAVIKYESDFDSSILSEDGSIGLMQISPETFESQKGSLKDTYIGVLYDPDTNIKYGTYMLSKMYIKLGSWKSVFAAMTVGEETVEVWLQDPEISDIIENAKPILRDIPDEECEETAEEIGEIADMYKKLYFSTVGGTIDE